MVFSMKGMYIIITHTIMLSVIFFPVSICVLPCKTPVSGTKKIWAGILLFAQLVFMRDSREKDMQKAISDRAYQKQLFKEYNI